MVAGSSPLARGLQSLTLLRLLLTGIIPARAGFTNSSSQKNTASPDHPRSRGVYDCDVGGVVNCVGSSPLARGLRLPDG